MKKGILIAIFALFTKTALAQSTLSPKGETIVPKQKAVNRPYKKNTWFAKDNFPSYPSHWGVGFEFLGGYGIFTGNLKNQFTNIGFLGISFDIYYKNLVLYSRGYLGIGFTKQDQTGKSVVWNKHSQANVYFAEASLGLVIHNGEYFRLCPFAGIATTDIVPPDGVMAKNPGLREYELTFTTTYTVGFNLDYKFGARVKDLFVRFRYSCNYPQFAKKYPGYDGNLQFITIGVGGMGGSRKNH